MGSVHLCWLIGWTSLALPHSDAHRACVPQAEAQHVSLSALDHRCALYFFYWNVFNFFLGALLGGSVAAGIQSLISGDASESLVRHKLSWERDMMARVQGGVGVHQNQRVYMYKACQALCGPGT